MFLVYTDLYLLLQAINNSYLQVYMLYIFRKVIHVSIPKKSKQVTPPAYTYQGFMRTPRFHCFTKANEYACTAACPLRLLVFAVTFMRNIPTFGVVTYSSHFFLCWCYSSPSREKERYCYRSFTVKDICICIPKCTW
jgi:hypothetical protein